MNFWEYALSFNGVDGYVATHAYREGVGTTMALTIEAWCRIDEGQQGRWSIFDFDRSEHFNAAFGDGVNPSPPGVAAGYPQFGSSSPSVKEHDLHSPTDITGTGWRHVAWVFDGVDKIIYIDGQEDARSVNPHGGEGLGTGVLRYAMLGDGSEADVFNGPRNNIYFHGYFRDVRFWNVARTQAEIQANMNAGLTGTEPGLVSLYLCDDGDGSVLTDSASGYDGAIYGGATWAWLDRGVRPETHGSLWVRGYDEWLEAQALNFASEGSRTLTFSLRTIGHLERTGPLMGEPGAWALTVLEGGLLEYSHGGATVVAAPEARIRLERWHHLAVVIDRTLDEVRVYLNAVLAATMPNPPVAAPASTFILGGLVPGEPSQMYNGVLTYCFLWDKALSDQELQEAIWADPVGYGTDILLAYTMDEVSETVPDLSGTNDGVIYGGKILIWGPGLPTAEPPSQEGVPDPAPYTLSAHRLAGRTLLDGNPVRRRVVVRNRRTGGYIASTNTQDDGVFEFTRLPVQSISHPHVVTCYDDNPEGFGNALTFDRVLQLDDSGNPPQV